MNKDRSKRIVSKLMHEMDIPSYSMGKIMASAISDPVGGLAFVQDIFDIPGMGEKIVSLGEKIRQCNDQYRKNKLTNCVEDMKKEREKIRKEIQGHGYFFTWDVFDNFWDKLPGD